MLLRSGRGFPFPSPLGRSVNGFIFTDASVRAEGSVHVGFWISNEDLGAVMLPSCTDIFLALVLGTSLLFVGPLTGSDSMISVKVVTSKDKSWFSFFWSDVAELLKRVSTQQEV